jgi:hypothetical protein
VCNSAFTGPQGSLTAGPQRPNTADLESYPFHPDQILLARAVSEGREFVCLTSGQVVFIGNR